MEPVENSFQAEPPVEPIGNSREEHGWVPTLPVYDDFGTWPNSHPLPLPKWSRPRETFSVASVEDYEELAASVELTVQHLIQAYNYNTVGNFIRFYSEFNRSGETNVGTFFRRYIPPITSDHHTCVGLGMELLQKLRHLENKFPKLKNKFYLVSCEEAIDNLDGYISTDPRVSTSEKEHILVALKIIIGSRSGILLLDPGYHVARVITVMRDQMYPNTGWFLQSDEPHVRKEYCYTFAENTDYIMWMERQTREGIEAVSRSVIYVARPYITPVHVTERRNLVYNFRSLLARDTKGHLVAGIYFPVKESANVVLFYQDGNRKYKCQVPMANSIRGKQEREIVYRCGLQLGLSVGALETILDKVAVILGDKDFLSQLLDINREINGISQEN
ncbi:hypothetical protein RUM44_005365 [Polyplax serrata]|uniref:Uncharacterized protein n=1 Tax=Polyplax serrata TaxID=468196 RepID=A0ABR1AEY5_POLSC